MNDNVDNVVTFGGNKPKPEVLLGVCGKCSCTTFRLLSTGCIECANCEEHLRWGKDDPNENNWRRFSETAPTDPVEVAKLPDEDGTISVKGLGNANFARMHVMKKINDWSKADELALVVGYDINGEGSIWLNISTPEQKAWAVHKVGYLLEHIKQSQNFEEEKQ